MPRLFALNLVSSSAHIFHPKHIPHTSNNRCNTMAVTSERKFLSSGKSGDRINNPKRRKSVHKHPMRKQLDQSGPRPRICPHGFATTTTRRKSILLEKLKQRRKDHQRKITISAWFQLCNNKSQDGEEVGDSHQSSLPPNILLLVDSCSGQPRTSQLRHSNHVQIPITRRASPQTGHRLGQSRMTGTIDAYQPLGTSREQRGRGKRRARLLDSFHARKNMHNRFITQAS